MWVLNKDKTAIINIDHAECIFLICLDAEKMTWIWASVGTNTKKLGEYSDKRKAEFALGMLFSAISAGARYFEMPSEEEMEFQTQHRSDVRNRHNRHGGS